MLEQGFPAAVEAVRQASRRDAEEANAGEASVVVARGIDTSGAPRALRVELVSRRGCWIMGLVPALVARLVLEGRARPGNRFMIDAIDPATLVAELGRAGAPVAIRDPS